MPGPSDITGALTTQNGAAITNTTAGSGVTVEGTGTLTLQLTSSISGGKVTVNSGGKLNLQDTSTASGVAMSNAGTLNLSGASALNGSGSLTNTGQVNVTSGGGHFQRRDGVQHRATRARSTSQLR